MTEQRGDRVVRKDLQTGPGQLAFRTQPGASWRHHLEPGTNPMCLLSSPRSLSSSLEKGLQGTKDTEGLLVTLDTQGLEHMKTFPKFVCLCETENGEERENEPRPPDLTPVLCWFQSSLDLLPPLLSCIQ